MWKVFKSKKGSIPVVNEIINILVGILPRPILLLIFVLLIPLIINIFMPILLNFVGYTCVLNGNSMELYQVPFSNIIDKTFLELERGFRFLFFQTDFKLPEDPFPNNDKRYLRIPSDCFISSDLNGTVVYGYSASCVNCDTNANFLQSFFTPRDQQVCTSDGTERIINLANTKFCSQCAPPEPYYYNHSVCTSQNECFFTITNESLVGLIGADFENNLFLQRVKGIGGTFRPQQSDEFVNIQCSEVGKPSLFFFSIEIFNQQMWILLLVGGMLISFAMMWYGQIL